NTLNPYSATTQFGGVTEILPEPTSNKLCGLYHMYNLDEPICPRFILEFYSRVNLIQNEVRTFSIQFWFQDIEITLKLEMFAKLLGSPHNEQSAYFEDYSLISHRNSREIKDPDAVIVRLLHKVSQLPRQST
ncbi:hypothetical protein Tco_0601267, partial [Tanacetum coccineum]